MKPIAGAIMTFSGAMCLAADRIVSRIPTTHPDEMMHSMPIGISGMLLVILGIFLAFRDEFKKSGT
jgi:hypothetical protein